VEDTEELLERRLELDTLEISKRAAVAGEKNVRYVFWATLFAAVSALVAAVPTFVSLGSKLVAFLK
jgi:hypothetical protein